MKRIFFFCFLLMGVWESCACSSEKEHTQEKERKNVIKKRERKTKGENVDKIGGIRNEGEQEEEKKEEMNLSMLISDYLLIWARACLARVWVKVESWRAKRRRNWERRKKGNKKERERAARMRHSCWPCVVLPSQLVKKKEEASPPPAPPPYRIYIPTSFYRAVILLGAVGVIPFLAEPPIQLAAYIYMFR